MGWLYGWSTKQELIKHLQEKSSYSKGFRPIKHSLIGNNHWTLLRTPEDKITIALELISCDQGQYGYKGISEDMGPTQINCPLSFVNAADDTDSPYAKEWREKVRNFHQRKKSRPSYSSGQKWLFGGKKYRLLESAGKRKGWLATEMCSGQVFRFPFVHLAKAEFVSA
jgi:hypothetical protein